VAGSACTGTNVFATGLSEMAPAALPVRRVVVAEGEVAAATVPLDCGDIVAIPS
jgi:hypothetical protein